MTPIVGNFYSALTYIVAWRSLTMLAPGVLFHPTVPNGFYYSESSGGTTGATEPTWPPAIGATVVDGTVTWTCAGRSLSYLLETWDQIQSQAISGDNGGCWAPSTALTFNATAGGGFNVTGPTQ